MRKIIFLWAILFVSGMAFGQKEGKVLWENAVDTITAGAYVNNLGGPIASPSGNVFVQFNYVLNNNIRKSGSKLYDKNGKIIWDAKDFYQNAFQGFSANVQNKNYTLLSNFSYTRTGYGSYDSTVYLGKNFNFLRKFEAEKQTAALMPVDDGVFYYENGKSLVKYNSEGKEEWRYDSPYQILIQNKKAPYIGSVLTYSQNQETVIILNKDGKKIGATEPQSFGTIYPANDKGFWLINAYYEKNKFDSTGRQTAKVSPIGGQYNVSSDGNSVLSDNSLLLSFVNDKALYLKKTSAKGDEIDLTIPFPYQIKGGNFFKFKEIAPNIIMYAIAMPEREVEADIVYKIGVVNFNDNSKSWSKDVLGGASNGIYGNAFTFEAGNIFFQAYSDPNQPLLKTFRTYDINGNLKWNSPYGLSSPQGFPLQWKIIGDYVYFLGSVKDSNGSYEGAFFKIRFNDGKIIWRKKYGIPNFSDYSNYIKKDNNGNDVLFYLFDVNRPDITTFNYTYSYQVAVLNEDGSEKWVYNLNKTDNNQIYNKTFFTPTDDGKLVVLSQETKDNKLQYILRKISPCGDLNAISISANKTEACPTEKVKLTAPKQDGVTYQWQRDGKDLPNVTDAVYDFGEAGTYTVVVKDELCQNQAISNALKINIRSLATAQITAPKSTFCEGDKTTIAATTNGTFFQWQKDEKDIPNATSGIYEVSQAGNYRVGVRDDKCPQVGFSNVFTINVKSTPEAKISTDIKGVIYEPFTVKMTANSGSGLNYQWLKDDAIIPNETTANYEAKNSGKYNVSVTQDGCTKTSEALTISILIPLANEGEIGEDVVQVYPNPSKGEFKITLPKSLKSANIQLFNILGREHSLIYTGEQAQAEGLVQGVYFLKVSKGEKVVTSKIIIE